MRHFPSKFQGARLSSKIDFIWVMITNVGKQRLHSFFPGDFLRMNNQKTMLVIIAIAAALSVAIAPTMMNTAMADDPFDGKGNPHDEPGAKDGDPHIDKKTGNPHRCPGKTCDD